MSNTQEVTQGVDVEAVEAAKAAKKAAAEAAKAAKDAAKQVEKAAKEAAKAQAKAEKDALKETAKLLKAEAKAAKAAEAAGKKVKVSQPQQNGVTRPKAEGACGKVWAIADSISQRIGEPVSIAMLQKETSQAGLNDATTRTQYARWKQYNGVIGRVPTPAQPAEAVAA